MVGIIKIWFQVNVFYVLLSNVMNRLTMAQQQPQAGSFAIADIALIAKQVIPKSYV